MNIACACAAPHPALPAGLDEPDRQEPIDSCVDKPRRAIVNAGLLIDTVSALSCLCHPETKEILPKR